MRRLRRGLGRTGSAKTIRPRPSIRVAAESPWQRGRPRRNLNLRRPPLPAAPHPTRHPMRAVLQRVRRAKVTTDGEVAGEIATGWLILLGVAPGDSGKEIEWLADKVANLRAFPDDAGKMNRSVQEVGGAVLVVSQFTLYGDCRKGRRPGF